MNLICSLEVFIHISCFFSYPNKPSHGMADLFFKLIKWYFEGYFSTTSVLLPGMLSPLQFLSLGD